MSTAFKFSTFKAPPPLHCTSSLSSRRVFFSSFRYAGPKHCSSGNSLKLSNRLPRRFTTFLPFASQGEIKEADPIVDESESEDDSDVSVHEQKASSDSDSSDAEELPTSAIISSLHSYRKALESDDDSKLAEVESFLKSFENDKNALEAKVNTLSEQLASEKSRVLRISADFDNFRKRTERERFSVVGNAQGEVLENLLPVLDNFELAKSQIKVESEGEEKINKSYQSIYKQFIEVMDSLGVDIVETTGSPFDPLLHEAIMREESAEFEEGVIIQEFRKGFKLGDKLMRPSMVKVSAGPGPAKPAPKKPDPSEEDEPVKQESPPPDGANEEEKEQGDPDTNT